MNITYRTHGAMTGARYISLGQTHLPSSEPYGIAALSFWDKEEGSIGNHEVAYLNRDEVRKIVDELVRILNEAGPEPINADSEYLRDNAGYIWKRVGEDYKNRPVFLAYKRPDGTELTIPGTREPRTAYYVHTTYGPVTPVVRKVVEVESFEDAK